MGQMTKMVAIPIHGKNPLKIFFSQTKGLMAFGLGMQHLGHGPKEVGKNDNLGLTLTFFMERSSSFT